MADLEEICNAELRFDGHTLCRCQLRPLHKGRHLHDDGEAHAAWDDNGDFQLARNYRI